MSDQLRRSVRYRTLNVIDDYNRELLGIDIANSILSLRVARYLDRLAEWHSCPYQNAYIERFNRTYRHEVLDLYLFENLNEVRPLNLSTKWLY